MLTSLQLVEWLEAKLDKLGIGKVIPQQATLEIAFRRSLEAALLNQSLESIRGESSRQAQQAKLPTGLCSKSRRPLKKPSTALGRRRGRDRQTVVKTQARSQVTLTKVSPLSVASDFLQMVTLHNALSYHDLGLAVIPTALTKRAPVPLESVSAETTG